MQNKEIERKWLIKNFPEELPLIEKATLYPIYLSVDPEVRARRKVTNGKPVLHHLTIKSNGGLSRTEVEVKISRDQFEALVEMSGYQPIEKEFRLYELPDGLRLECSCVDPGKETEFWYAEIEFPNEEAAKSFEPLNFFDKEVTEDPYYKMKNYWKRTHLNTTNSDSDPNKDACKDCDHKEDCENLNNALNHMGSFGDRVREMIKDGRARVIHPGSPSGSKEESEEKSEDPMTPMEMSEALAFTAANVDMIHQHLDGFGFNERQLSEIEGIVHKEAEEIIAALRGYHPYRSEWPAVSERLAEVKVGKIKSRPGKKKIKKMIKKAVEKSLNEFLNSKRLKKKIRKIACEEACKVDLGEEVSDLEERMDDIDNFIDDLRSNGDKKCDGCECKDGKD